MTRLWQEADLLKILRIPASEKCFCRLRSRGISPRICRGYSSATPPHIMLHADYVCNGVQPRKQGQGRKLIPTRCYQLVPKPAFRFARSWVPPHLLRGGPRLRFGLQSYPRMSRAMASARRRGGLRATKTAVTAKSHRGALRLTCVMFGYLGTRLESRWLPFLRLTRLDWPALYRS